MHLTESFIPSGQAHLAAQACGPGPAVVLLHAGVADARMWHGQLAALGPSHHAVAYDRRGFGRSQHADEPYSMVGDLLAVLDAVSPAAPAVLVGCSQGGRVAIDAALAHPQRVRALVLVAPALSGAPQVDSFQAPIQSLVDQLERAEASGDIDRINALEAQAWLDGPAAPPGRVGGAVRDLFLDMNGIALRAPSRGTEIEPIPAADCLHRVQAPTLLVWGDLDFPHLQARCRTLAAQIPQVRCEVLPGTAHLPNLEQPERFNRALLAFCDSLPPCPGY
jgi:pimeloyl-ACP methyl ester carboxylesterase